MADFQIPLNQTLRIFMKPFSPYVNPCGIYDDEKRCRKESGGEYYPGMDVELMDYMIKFLGINYSRHTVPEEEFKRWGGWGKINEEGTGLDGILGQVEQNNYDTVGVWYGITKPRQQFIEFSHPILYTRSLGFIMHKPAQGMGMDASALLYKVFSPLIWAVILALTVGLIILLCIAPNFKQWSDGRKFKSIRDYDFEGIWGSICLALHQFHQSSSTGTVFGNMAMISAGFFFLFVSTLYEGVLVGTLMQKSDKVPFRTLTELAGQVMKGNYRLVSDEGSGNAFFWDMIKNPETHSHKLLNQSIEAKGFGKKERDIDKLLDMIVADPKLVWPGQDKLSGIHWVKTRCGLIFQDDEDATFGIPAAFVFRKGSVWTEAFTQLLANTAAYVKHLEDKYLEHELSNMQDRAVCAEVAQKEGDPLTIRNMFGIIVVSTLMFAASVILLLLEIGMRRFQQRMLAYVNTRMPAIKTKVKVVGALAIAHRVASATEPVKRKAIRNLVASVEVPAKEAEAEKQHGFYRQIYGGSYEGSYGTASTYMSYDSVTG